MTNIGTQSPQAACRPARQRYDLTLEAHGDDPTMALRSALKVLWRRFDLKCLSVKEAQAIANARTDVSAKRGVSDG